MDERRRATQLFDRWKTNLAKKPPGERETSRAQANFDELFYELFINQVDFDSAQAILHSAVAAHMPSHALVEIVWQKSKARSLGLSKKEWIDSWRTRIEEAAKAAFYTWYKIPGEEEIQRINTGNMSPQEYALQQRYAESYPTITRDELEAIEEKRQRFLSENLDDLIFDE